MAAGIRLAPPAPQRGTGRLAFGGQGRFATLAVVVIVRPQAGPTSIKLLPRDFSRFRIGSLMLVL